MDGVRFSPENYVAQPLFNPSDSSQFTISPGHRADFLIEAPTTPGVCRGTQRLAGKSQVAGGKREKIRLRDEALLKLEAAQPGAAKTIGAASETALISLVVEGPAGKPPKKPQKAALATGFPPPSLWPPMPWYLSDLPGKAVPDEDLSFEMTRDPGDPTIRFEINGEPSIPNGSYVTTPSAPRRLGWSRTAARWPTRSTFPSSRSSWSRRALSSTASGCRSSSMPARSGRTP